MAFSKLPCLLGSCQLGAAGAGHSCDLVGGQEEGTPPPPRAMVTLTVAMVGGCGLCARGVLERGATVAARVTEASSSSDTSVNGMSGWALAFCSAGETVILMVAVTAAAALLQMHGLQMSTCSWALGQNPPFRLWVVCMSEFPFL